VFWYFLEGKRGKTTGTDGGRSKRKPEGKEGSVFANMVKDRLWGEKITKERERTRLQIEM